MIYKIDNKPLSDFGAHPARGTHFFALEGFFDLPKRIGKTEYDWGTSIEPFVMSEDIILDGRTLTLNAVMKKDKLEAFKTACVGCKILSMGNETFNVVCKDEIQVTEIDDYTIAVVKFWQYDFQLQLITIVPSGSGLYSIDNYSLNKDFGISISKSNNLSNTAKRIDVNTTEFYKITEYRNTRSIEIQCSMIGSSFLDVQNKMNQFQSVLMSPGMRVLTIRNNLFNVYFKDGFAVEVISENILKFNLKATVV